MRIPAARLAAAGFGLVLLAAGHASAQQQSMAVGPLAAGQTVTLAPSVEAHTRTAARLTIPAARGRQQQTMAAALGDWQLLGPKREIRIPAQKFSYVAELRTGSVVTTLGNQRLTRRTGALWVVPAGQPMTVTLGPRQESGLLRILALQPVR